MMSKATPTKDRLSKEEWLSHSLEALASQGFTALKADKLAKSLGVSRGSFYWHFKDLRDFHTQVLETWKSVMVSSTIEQLEGVQTASGNSLDAKTKLEQLVTQAATNDPSLEQSIRAWAFSDSEVQKAVAEVDSLCLQYLESLFQAMGFTDDLVRAKARIIYAGYIGNIMLGGDIPKNQKTQLVEELLKVVD